MGTLLNNFMFTGRLGPASAYTMRGHDKIVIRSRGGAKKHVIQSSPNFEVTRQLNGEWKAVVKAAGAIRNELGGLKPMADYNVSGPLNALVKKIQTSDTVNEKGKRSVLFSRYPDFFSSFQYNKQTLFDSIIRQQLEVNIDKSSSIATVTIPVLQPAIHFFPNPRYAYYRLIIDMAAASDLIWNEETMSFKPVAALLPKYKSFYADWVPASSTQALNTYQLTPAKEEFSTGPDMILILGAGIQYGMPSPDGSIQPVPYAGAARIIKCV